MGEDGGLLGVVAAEAGAKADNAVDLPGSSTVLAVQGATRVPLFQRDEQILKTLTLIRFLLARSLTLSQLSTHVATGHHPVSACTDHFGGHLRTPPVIPGAGGVVDHGQESLLQNVSNGTSSCGQERWT